MKRRVLLILCILMTVSITSTTVHAACDAHTHLANHIDANRANAAANGPVPVPDPQSSEAYRQQAATHQQTANSLSGSADASAQDARRKNDVADNIGALIAQLDAGEELTNIQSQILIETMGAEDIIPEDSFLEDDAVQELLRPASPSDVTFDRNDLILLQEAAVNAAVDDQAKADRFEAQSNVAADEAISLNRQAAEAEAVEAALKENKEGIEDIRDSETRQAARDAVARDARAAFNRQNAESASTQLATRLTAAKGDQAAEARAYRQYTQDRFMPTAQANRYYDAQTHTLQVEPHGRFINMPRNTVVPDNIQGMTIRDGEVVALVPNPNYDPNKPESDSNRRNNDYAIGMDCDGPIGATCSQSDDGTITMSEDGYYYGDDGELYYLGDDNKPQHQAQYWPTNSLVDMISGGPTSGLLKSLSSEIYGERGHSGWRDKQGVAQLYEGLGKLDVASWITEELCSGNLQSIDGSTQIVLTKGGQTAVHIEGERIEVGDVCGNLPPAAQDDCRSDAIQKAYLYRVTAYVTAMGIEGAKFTIVFSGPDVNPDFDLFAGDTYSLDIGTPPLDYRGNNMILQESDELFDRVCIKFSGNTDALQHQLIGMPRNHEICNTIDSASSASAERQYEMLQEGGSSSGGSSEGGHSPNDGGSAPPTPSQFP